MTKAIIVDIDGTLVTVGDRSYFDASIAHKVDTPKQEIVDLVQLYFDAGYYVFFVTGRNSHAGQFESTEKQLTNLFPNFEDYFLDKRTSLHMRRKGDFRKDTIFKGEVYERHIKDKYEVAFALEDRKQMVDFYRNELGITCLEVEENVRK